LQGEVGRYVRRQVNYIILLNIKMVRLKHLKAKVKTQNPEQLALSHVLLDVKS
jgi:hypothetical protein